MADKIEILVREEKYKTKGKKLYEVEISLKSYPVSPLSLAEAEIGKQVERICDIILEDLRDKVNNSDLDVEVIYHGVKKRVQ